MINFLHSLLHQPARGWDPVPPEHARRYADLAWKDLNPALVDDLERRLGGLGDKRVLDLGGGPGQYSIAFARRGARVTWHDVSRAYLAIAREGAAQAGVRVDFSLGYLEDARRLAHAPFDLVFCRICWNYCRNDRVFARLVFRLMRPGGAAYIDANTEDFARPHGRQRLAYALYRLTGWKIGHPYPPRGRLARLFRRLPLARLEEDGASGFNDRLFLIKGRPVL